MKQFFFWGFIFLLAAINWAALHDILKGEPNPWMEWSFVIGSAVLALVCVFRKVRTRR